MLRVETVLGKSAHVTRRLWKFINVCVCTLKRITLWDESCSRVQWCLGLEDDSTGSRDPKSGGYGLGFRCLGELCCSLAVVTWDLHMPLLLQGAGLRLSSPTRDVGRIENSSTLQIFFKPPTS